MTLRTDIGPECIRGAPSLCLCVRMTECVCVHPYRREWKGERVRSGASAEVNTCGLEDEALLTRTQKVSQACFEKHFLLSASGSELDGSERQPGEPDICVSRHQHGVCVCVLFNLHDQSANISAHLFQLFQDLVSPPAPPPPCWFWSTLELVLICTGHDALRPVPLWPTKARQLSAEQ